MIIRPMTMVDAQAAASLLFGDPPDYRRDFVPFADWQALIYAVSKAQRDQFWGIHQDEIHGYRCLGFFMLRGLDAGHPRPSFGVYIGERYSEKGLGKLALDAAIAWCNLHEIDILRLTVAPDNLIAKIMYEEAGFVATGKRSEKGHVEMIKDLAVRRAR